MGPDEYHAHVDDNAYTNVMARWNLRRAAGAGRGKWIDARKRRRWLELADALVDGYAPASGVYEQFAGFHDARAPPDRRGRPSARSPPTSCSAPPASPLAGHQAARRPHAPPPCARGGRARLARCPTSTSTGPARPTAVRCRRAIQAAAARPRPAPRRGARLFASPPARPRRHDPDDRRRPAPRDDGGRVAGARVRLRRPATDLDDEGVVIDPQLPPGTGKRWSSASAPMAFPRAPAASGRTKRWFWSEQPVRIQVRQLTVPRRVRARRHHVSQPLTKETAMRAAHRRDRRLCRRRSRPRDGAARCTTLRRRARRAPCSRRRQPDTRPADRSRRSGCDAPGRVTATPSPRSRPRRRPRTSAACRRRAVEGCRTAGRAIGQHGARADRDDRQAGDRRAAGGLRAVGSAAPAPRPTRRHGGDCGCGSAAARRGCWTKPSPRGCRAPRVRSRLDLAFSDHAGHEADAWGEEFVRRFLPTGDRAGDRAVVLETRVGRAADVVREVARDMKADMVVLGWKQDLASGRAQVVSALLADAEVPISLVPLRLGTKRLAVTPRTSI